MKFSEKKTQTLLALYEHKFDDKFYDISELLHKWGINISVSEAIQIGKSLESEGFIKLAASKDGASAYITGEGVEFVEEYDFFTETNLHTDFSQEEILVLNRKLDLMLERLTKLEFGQQITYDDLKEEIEELKELTKVINKKNWFELLQGKLISIGFGKISDQVINIIEDTLGGRQLIE